LPFTATLMDPNSQTVRFKVWQYRQTLLHSAGLRLERYEEENKQIFLGRDQVVPLSNKDIGSFREISNLKLNPYIGATLGYI